MKGGDVAACSGRRCLFAGLLATVGAAPLRSDGGDELPLLTAGDLSMVQDLLFERDDYSAADVVSYLQQETLAGV
jgi:hypothetical protein